MGGLQHCYTHKKSQILVIRVRCANLLKLPDYVNYHTLKAKVLQAIRPVTKENC